MRTTVTLDPDNVTRLEKLQSERDRTFEKVVNDVIRLGLDEAEKALCPQPFKTLVLDLGEPKFKTQKELRALMDRIQLEEDLRKIGRL
jgi:hypothetical protein